MAKNKEPKAVKPKRAKKEGKSNGLTKFFFAIVMAIVVFIALIVIQSGILSNFETTQVVVAKMEIPKGTDINENNYQDYFGYVELESAILPDGIVTDIEITKDNVTSQDIANGEFININALVSVDDVAHSIAGGDNVDVLVISGFNSGDLSNSVCGILRRGDIIDITLIYEDDLGNLMSKVLPDIYVRNSYDANGAEIFAGDEATATMFNFLLTRDEDDMLNEIIRKGGLVRIRRTSDPQF